jgi:glycosyltransferase involved in cell wall biosynthesis
VTTLHGRQDLPDLQYLYDGFPAMPLVSISDAQRAPIRNANFAGTVHHGLPPDLLRPTLAPRGGYLAFLGRISPEKGVDRAIAIARAAGLPLRIAAKVDRVDEEYFRAQIAPLLATPGVEYIGEIDDRRKGQFLGDALALLFPINWPEPFGLAQIEAMACATPVLAFRNGAVGEVIDVGVTGHVVDSIEEAIGKLAAVLALDRGGVRRRFEERFSVSRMAGDYLKIYARLVGKRMMLRDVQPAPPPVAKGAERAA